MIYLTNFQLFESSDNIQFSDKDGKLVITIDNKTYFYQISVDMGLLNINVTLDNIVKQTDGDFQIDGKLKGIPKKVELSKLRANKIIDKIKSELSKTGKPPVEITSKKEKPNQMNFILTLV